MTLQYNSVAEGKFPIYLLLVYPVVLSTPGFEVMMVFGGLYEVARDQPGIHCIQNAIFYTIFLSENIIKKQLRSISLDIYNTIYCLY